jgi:hypothetical protein
MQDDALARRTFSAYKHPVTVNVFSNIHVLRVVGKFNSTVRALHSFSREIFTREMRV